MKKCDVIFINMTS